MAKKFTFIAGADDFLVTRLGRETFDRMSGAGADEFSVEVIDAAAGNLKEVGEAITLFEQAVQTLPMFGGRKSVWLKDVSFLADSVTGRAEGTLEELERLRVALEQFDSSQVDVLVTAAPVDRRRAFYKWCEKNAELTWIASPTEKGSSVNPVQIAQQEAKRQGVAIGMGAAELLVGKLNGNTRLIISEIEKLTTYLGREGGTVDERLVAELVPNFGEGDFFEGAEAFYSLDLGWTLDAFHRHFFAGNGARPLITTLQGRNRLLIQVSALIDSGELRLGPRGLDKTLFDRAAASYSGYFGEKPEKSGFNVFTQNLWYLGRLSECLRKLNLRRLIDFQMEFLRAFEETISRPDDEAGVMREMAIRCLS